MGNKPSIGSLPAISGRRDVYTWRGRNEAVTMGTPKYPTSNALRLRGWKVGGYKSFIFRIPLCIHTRDAGHVAQKNSHHV